MMWTCQQWKCLVHSLLLNCFVSILTMGIGMFYLGNYLYMSDCFLKERFSMLKVWSFRYDLKDTSKITLVDLQLIAAMGPPGGGRNAVTPRFLRHFNICSINAFSDDTMSRIFSNVVTFYFRNNGFPPDSFTVGNQIVSATLEVNHTTVQSFEILCLQF